MAKKSTVAIGKKKSATARATVKNGTGLVSINAVPLSKWGSILTRTIIREPLFLIRNVSSKLDTDVTVSGGGCMSQALACRVAIARGITQHTRDKTLKVALESYDSKILSGDSRQREPNKPGDSSPRSKRQKSYR